MMTGTWSTVALMMGRSIMADGGEGEQKENGGKHGQDSQALHLPVLLGAGGVGDSYSNYLQAAVPGRAGYSAYLDAATGRDGPAVSLRGVQRPAARDSRGHYNGYILRLHPIVENLRLFWYNW